MTEMFGEAWSPMSVPDLAPDDDDDIVFPYVFCKGSMEHIFVVSPGRCLIPDSSVLRKQLT